MHISNFYTEFDARRWQAIAAEHHRLLEAAVRFGWHVEAIKHLQAEAARTSAVARAMLFHMIGAAA